jgi:transcriptional regulator with XRE-family HTH domain
MAGTGVRYYREVAGLKQAELAERLGTDPGRMSRIETGAEIPTPAEIDKLVEALQIPPTYLFSKHVLAEVAERSRAAAAT